MIGKFSIINMVDEDKKAQEKIKNRKDRELKKEKHNGLNEHIINSLILLGSSLDQVLVAYGKYKFKTTEEAVQIMFKDDETNLYYHDYIKGDNLECQICFGVQEEHYLKKDFPVDHIVAQKTKDYLNQKNKNPLIYDNNNKIEGIINLNNNEILLENKLIPRVKQDTNISFDLNIDYDSTCPICLDTIILTDKDYYSLSCSHKICKLCVEKYITLKINDGLVSNFFCLYGGCRKEYSKDVIKCFVSTDNWKKFKLFYNNLEKQKIINSNFNIIYCSYPDCSELLEIDQGIINSNESYIVQCQKGHPFCVKCRISENKHNDIECDKMNNSILNQIKRLNKNGHINYKQCPSCKNIIEKVDGCNSIKCAYCDFKFCWLCLKELYDDHYALYNFTGCPGLENGKC